MFLKRGALAWFLESGARWNRLRKRVGNGNDQQLAAKGRFGCAVAVGKKAEVTNAREAGRQRIDHGCQPSPSAASGVSSISSNGYGFEIRIKPASFKTFNKL